MSLSKGSQLLNDEEIQRHKMTQDRIKKIVQCRQDALYRTTLPMALVTGLTTFLGLKAGVFPKGKSGTAYQVFSSTLTTAVLVETFCSILCAYKRYPNNNVHKPSIEAHGLPNIELPDETNYDKPSASNDDQSLIWNTKDINTDTNNQYINNDYAYPDKVDDEYVDDKPTKKYVTYDDLRRKNMLSRESDNDNENSSAFSENVQKKKSRLFDAFHTKQTKYGDVWEE